MARETVIGKLEPSWVTQRESKDDLLWLIEKARLALELDVFCTTQEDRDRLDRIHRRLV